ncbi:MAG: type II secretion system protein, partial [Chloroflexota bacterium]
MRLPKRGEKGFTLIELLIVVAILGVLAAVVIPNVGRFIGRGETEAAETEFSNLQSAVVAMMTDNGLEELPTGFVADAGSATDNMSLFPHPTAATVTVKVNDPDGTAYTASDKNGY